MKFGLNVFGSFFKRTHKIRLLCSTKYATFQKGSSPVKSFLYTNSEGSRIITRVVHPNLDNILVALETAFEACLETLRKRAVAVDLHKLHNVWKNFQRNNEILESLENDKEILESQIGELDKNASNYESEQNRIKSTIRTLKQKMKEQKFICDEDEETVMLSALALPNLNIHPRTPSDSETVIHEYKSKPVFNFRPKSHMEIGLKSNMLIKSPFCFNHYLAKDAAMFELKAIEIFSKYMRKSKFTQLSNPDLFKPVVVEGCGIDVFDPQSVFILEPNDKGNFQNLKSTYLSGGATLPAFCAYFTRMNVRRSFLPFRNFAVGRCYQPNNNFAENSLVNSVQSTKLHFCIVTENKEELVETEYNFVLELFKSMYETFGIHFQVVNVPVCSLSKAESLRTSFRLWMPASESYVEVAQISQCNDFISRRLTCCQCTAKSKGYLSILHGDVVNIFHLLASIMENTQSTTELNVWHVLGNTDLKK